MSIFLYTLSIRNIFIIAILTPLSADNIISTSSGSVFLIDFFSGYADILAFLLS